MRRFSRNDLLHCPRMEVRSCDLLGPINKMLCTTNELTNQPAASSESKHGSMKAAAGSFRGQQSFIAGPNRMR